MARAVLKLLSSYRGSGVYVGLCLYLRNAETHIPLHLPYYVDATLLVAETVDFVSRGDKPVLHIHDRVVARVNVVFLFSAYRCLERSTGVTNFKQPFIS
jgi:hypothetical protein